jgi:hypothetical protein
VLKNEHHISTGNSEGKASMPVVSSAASGTSVLTAQQTNTSTISRVLDTASLSAGMQKKTTKHRSIFLAGRGRHWHDTFCSKCQIE